MIDLRRLFNKYRIEWKDRGKNCSRGNVNICCPLCNKTFNKDHGFHLGIYEKSGQWHCFRNPKHSGHNPVFIFQLLKIPANEYKDIEFKEAPRSEKVYKNDFSQIDFFDPAEQNQEALHYLQNERLFSRPAEACTKFKLMTAKEGEWAGRLIIPLTIGWTGRAMRSHLELRYRTESTEDGFFLHRQGATTCILVEGALDAMRIVSVSSQFDVVGKCGNRLSPALLTYLNESKYLSIINIPDGDVEFPVYFQETRLLKSYCTFATVRRLDLPKDRKDFGTMTESEAREYLSQIGK